MKKIGKISIVLLNILVITMMMNAVFAQNVGGFVVSPDTNQTATTTISSAGNKIIGILQVVGAVIAVIIIIVLGLKYMMGSTEEKAEYKKTMLPYLIGAILVFAAAIFAKAIVEFAIDLGK